MLEQLPVDWIVALLAEGRSLEQIALTRLPEGQQALLRRCAAVRWFDEALVDAVLRDGVPGAGPAEVPFERLVESAPVEALPGLPGTYRLREETRSEQLADWLSAVQRWSEGSDRAAPPELPAEFSELTDRLIEYWKQRGPEGDAERLYHLAVRRPDDAGALFRDLYGAAEGRFDLPACFDLLQLLDERRRQELLAPLLTDLLREYDSYYQARALWAADYHRTVSSFERDFFAPAAARLLSKSPAWILEIDALGGMGKTVFLRWLVARRLVPQRIPCARIDFDHNPPVECTREPWLILWLAARQLNRQIPGTPFNELIDELEEYVYRQMPSMGAGDPAHPSGGTTSTELPRDRLEREFPDRFVTLLNRRPVKTPVVLVFDTLEEAILRPNADVMRLVDWLAGLREKCSDLRVVLSGRFKLGERYEEYRKRYESVSLPLSVEPFKPKEAAAYLEQRGLGSDPRVPAVIREAGGNPFVLALYVELLRSDPELTEEAIRRHPAHLVYLIERILLRIHEPHLQWMLRFGVAARHLTQEFVEHVLAPCFAALPAERRYQAIGRELRKEKLFPLVPTPDDLSQLWKDLNRYAAQAAWVSPAQDVPGGLVFHGDVRLPMRPVLGDDARPIHARAIAYFEQLHASGADPEGRALTEAVYHHFQLDGAEAGGAYWRGQLQEARTPALRLRLAADLIGPDYLDDSGHSLSGLSGPLLDPLLIGEAGMEAAEAALDLADAAQGEARVRLLNDAEAYQRRAQLASEELPDRTVVAGRLYLLEAGIDGRRGDGEAALKGLEQARGILEIVRNVRGEDRYRLHLEYGDRLAEAGRAGESWQEYAAALEEAVRLPDGESRAAVVELRLARRAAEREEWSEARDQYCAASRRSGFIGLRLQAQRGLAESYLAMGRPGQAHEAAFAVPEPLGLGAGEIDAWAELLVTRARVLLAQGQAFDAQSICGELVRVADRPGSPRSALAAAGELQAAISRALQNHEPAQREFEQASHAWRSLGQVEAAQRCTLAAAEMLLWDAGDYRGAETQLARAERVVLPVNSDVRLRTRVLRAELRHALGDAAAAHAELEDVLQELGTCTRTSTRLQIAAVGLGFAAGEQAERCLELLANGLERAQPPSSALPHLEPLARCRSFHGVSDDLRARLMDHVYDISSDGLGAVETIALVDLYRLLDRDDAQWLLQRTLRRLRSDPDIHLPEMLRAQDRLGWERQKIDWFSGAVERCSRDYGVYSIFSAGTLLEQAERLQRHYESLRAPELVDRAEELVAWTQPRSRVRARCHELEARLGPVRGTPGDRLTEALKIYEQLGDRRAVERLRLRVSGPAPGPPPEHSALRLRIGCAQQGPPALLTEMTLPPNLGRVPFPGFREIPPGEHARVVHMILERTEAGVSYDFIKHFESQGHWYSFLLAQAVFHPDTWPLLASLLSEGAREADFRLEFESPELDGLPWEFLTRPDGPPEGHCLSQFFRCFYRGLPEHYRTPRPPAPYGPPEVLLLRPGAAGERKASRGHSVGGLDLHAVYARAGFTVVTPEEPHPEAIATSLAEIRGRGSVPLLHACGSMQFHPSEGGAFLSLARGSLYGDYGAPPLSARHLVDLLRARGEEGDLLFVLDIVRPPDMTEALIQLCFRNRLGAELLRLDPTLAILGVGLAEPDQGWLYQHLADSLAQGGPIREVLSGFRSSGYREAIEGPFQGLDRMLPTVGAALFIDDPARSFGGL
jgi:hypothetical protein